MARLQQVQRRLRHADVRLDPHDGDGRRAVGAPRVEVSRDGRDPHAEGRLVGVLLDERGGEVGLQLRDGVAELGAVLRRHVHGDGEHFGGLEDLGCGEDAGGRAGDGRPGVSLWGEGRRGRGLTYILSKPEMALRNLS